MVNNGVGFGALAINRSNQSITSVMSLGEDLVCALSLLAVMLFVAGEFLLLVEGSDNDDCGSKVCSCFFIVRLSAAAVKDVFLKRDHIFHQVISSLGEAN